MSQQKAKLIVEHERCEVCKGEAIVSYIQSAGGFSEPAPCYKCKGTGRRCPQVTITPTTGE
jgi:hypothetical protein